MGKFEISMRKNGDYMFNLKAGNGEIILTSQGYASKDGCKNGIESVKKNALEDSNFERKTSSNDKPYFNLKAANGQIIGSSEMYSGKSACENGIASVMKNAPDADAIDLTLKE